MPREEQASDMQGQTSHNSEMDGDPEAVSSDLHPGQEVPGSTLEEGPLSSLLPLSNVSAV